MEKKEEYKAVVQTRKIRRVASADGLGLTRQGLLSLVIV